LYNLKVSALKLAVNAACTVLIIDQVRYSHQTAAHFSDHNVQARRRSEAERRTERHGCR
jgi:hypothetical protein